MRALNCLKKVKWVLATLATWTMVFSPVALGAQAERVSKEQAKGYLTQLGLDKQMTVGEFYTKNKDLFPERIQKELGPALMRFQNQKMPKFEIVTSKNTRGEEIATVRITAGKELINVQLLGEEDKFMRFQNVNLSENDIVNFDDMFKRITASNEKYRDAYTTDLLPTDNGFPLITLDTWKKMSQKDKAAYIVNMRMMWNDSRMVLLMLEDIKNRAPKKSSENDVFEKWKNFLKLLQPDAEAQAVRKAKAQPRAASAGQASIERGAGSSAFVSGDNCLVAGYTTSYTATKCDVKGIEQNYANDEFVKTANSECKSGSGNNRGSNFMACNPYVYGTPGGSPVCIDTTQGSFQIATHHNGPCDMASPLGSTQDFLNGKDDRSGKRYENVNWQDLENKYREEQKANPKYVEDYINGLMQYSKKKQIDFSKALGDDDFQEILKIRDAFNNDIVKARESCRKATFNKGNEKNFWGACDQLQRRYLFVAQFLEQKPGCPDGDKKVNPDSLKCSCGAGRPEVLPGSKCGAGPANPPAAGALCPQGTSDDRTGGSVVCLCTNGAAGPGVAPDEAKKMLEKAGSIDKLCPAQGEKPPKPTPGKQCGAIPEDENCECPGGGRPTVSATHSTGAQVLECKKPTVPAAGGPGSDKECGFLCTIGKGLKVAAPFLLAGAGVFLLYKLMKPKKPSLNAAADKCSNGTTPPCLNQCTAPLAMQANGTCGCPACLPGQSLTNTATCACSSTGTGTGTTTYTCWDGVTQVTDLNSCPARTYSCWDGSTVSNPLNCPEQPTTNSSPVKNKR